LSRRNQGYLSPGKGPIWRYIIRSLNRGWIPREGGGGFSLQKKSEAPRRGRGKNLAPKPVWEGRPGSKDHNKERKRETHEEIKTVKMSIAADSCASQVREPQAGWPPSGERLVIGATDYERRKVTETGEAHLGKKKVRDEESRGRARRNIGSFGAGNHHQ